MAGHTWVADVGRDNAARLADESPLEPQRRPQDLGDGRVRLDERALEAARGLGADEDGHVTDNDELLMWIHLDAYSLLADD
jgi:hypothetical protein